MNTETIAVLSLLVIAAGIAHFNADIEKTQLKRIMRGFTKQLGVECVYCHVKDAYHEDEKEHKLVARKMIRMMRHLNQNAADYFPDEGYEKLRCWTCHRGATEIEEFSMEDDVEPDKLTPAQRRKFQEN